MSLERIGNRYAGALYGLCENDLGKAHKYEEILSELARIFENPDISKVMLSPVVKSETKGAILKEILAHLSLDQELIIFLDTVAESGRVGAIPAIARSLKRIILDQENTVEAKLTTVFELDPSSLSDVKEKLEKISGKKVLLSGSIDKSILGGFVVQIGNSIIDMSLKTKLNAMSQAAVK